MIMWSPLVAWLVSAVLREGEEQGAWRGGQGWRRLSGPSESQVSRGKTKQNQSCSELWAMRQASLYTPPLAGNHFWFSQFVSYHPIKETYACKLRRQYGLNQIQKINYNDWFGPRRWIHLRNHGIPYKQYLRTHFDMFLQYLAL